MYFPLWTSHSLSNLILQKQELLLGCHMSLDPVLHCPLGFGLNWSKYCTYLFVSLNWGGHWAEVALLEQIWGGLCMTEHKRRQTGQCTAGVETGHCNKHWTVTLDSVLTLDIGHCNWYLTVILCSDSGQCFWHWTLDTVIDTGQWYCAVTLDSVFDTGHWTL